MTSKGSVGIFIGGFALGIIAGTIATIILAPKSGADTRDMVRDKVSDIGSRIKEATADRQDVYTKTWKENKGKYKVKPPTDNKD